MIFRSLLDALLVIDSFALAVYMKSQKEISELYSYKFGPKTRLIGLMIDWIDIMKTAYILTYEGSLVV